MAQERLSLLCARPRYVARVKETCGLYGEARAGGHITLIAIAAISIAMRRRAKQVVGDISLIW